MVQYETTTWWGRIEWKSHVNSTGTTLYREASDAKEDLDMIIKPSTVAAGTYYEHANGELGLTIIK